MEIAVEYSDSNMSDLRKTCIPMKPITDRLFFGFSKGRVAQICQRFAMGGVNFFAIFSR